jgi:hypothetical protein
MIVNETLGVGASREMALGKNMTEPKKALDITLPPHAVIVTIESIPKPADQAKP